VARVAATEALRSRLVLAVGLTIGLALAALAATATGDGTAAGRLRAFLSWGTGWTELVLSLTTVFLSTTLAQALRDGRLVMIVAGPLPRGLLPVGWWAGTALVLALLVAGAQALTWALARGVARGAPPAEAASVERVLTARGVARPIKPDLSGLGAKVDAQLEAMARAGELADQTPEQVDELREWLLQAEEERARTVARRQTAIFPIDGIDPAPDATMISLRFRYTARSVAGGRLPAGGVRGRFAIEPPGSPGEQVEGRWPGGVAHELPAPVSVLEGSSSVRVWYQNLEEQPVNLVFDEEGVVLLYPAGSFEGNVARAGLVLLGRLLVLAAVGVAAAALIDGKLAALVVLFVLAMGAGRDFLLESLGDHFTGFGAASPAVVAALRGVLVLVPDLSRADLAGLLSAGEQVDAWDVLLSLGVQGAGWALSLLAIVAVPFGRRELGAIR
jgi:hypothetical protein